MPIYLHEKYSKQVQEAYRKESVIKGLLSNDYDFTGNKTVKVSTISTVPLVDYVRNGANRYGTPSELEDTVQELTLSQDKAFTFTIDKGNNADQNGIKGAGKALHRQIKDRNVPLMDAYALNVIAHKGGTIFGGAAPTKTTIVERIADGTVALDDGEVPSTGRSLLISAAMYKILRLSPEFIGTEKLAVESLKKGQVGEFDGMPVIKVPKGRWPAAVNFMIVHKDAGCIPVKLDDTKIHQDPPGLSGHLVEGRQYYDCFILGTKSSGVYVDVDTSAGSIVAKPVIAIASNKATITAVTGVTFKYTTDGTDPRYSVSAEIYSGEVTLTAGQTFKAYGEKNGSFPSAVDEKTN